MPQLDALRALAALGVFVQHFLPDTLFGSTIPLGDLGVRLFFVLSGYLITGILLKSRETQLSTNISTTVLLGHFYGRRFLRLFPIYYLVLLIALVSLPGFTENAAWFFLYAQNLQASLLDGFVFADHFWTLAVEEQFYLLWPLLILLAPRQYLLAILIALVAMGPLSRLVLIYFGHSHFQISMLPTSHLDTLGLGGLLAVVTKSSTLRAQSTMLISCFVTGSLLLATVLVSKLLGMSSYIELMLGELGAGLLFTALIARAAAGFRGPIGWFLEQPWLVYLGKISYGMYVYHWFVPRVIEHFSVTRSIVPDNEYLQFLIYTLLAIGISALSWRFIERPANTAKRLFQYR